MKGKLNTNIVLEIKGEKRGNGKKRNEREN